MDDGAPAGRRPGSAVRLSDLTTLRVGGPARAYTEATSEAELVAAVSAADERNESVLVLGGGSNLVVGDDGFEGLVVAVRTRGVEPVGLAPPFAGRPTRLMVDVAAGESWDSLVELAVDSGWSGLECLAGIPGLVGASPIQNVGAYGQEVCSAIERVQTWDRVTGELGTLAHADCGFGYRTSRFKAEPGRFVVLAVRLGLPIDGSSEPIRYAELARTLGVELGARVPLADARAAVLQLRTRKGMVLDPADHDTWSAGSFFTNPILDPAAFEALRARAARRFGTSVVPPSYRGDDGYMKTSAAWLIERAGFPRGYGNERVRVSAKHTLALTNRGAATTADLLALAAEVRAGVLEVFGVQLTPEPVIVGAG